MTVTERAPDAGAADLIEAMARQAGSVDGVAPLGEQPLRALRGPAGGARHFLATAPDEPGAAAGGGSADPAIVGYAQLVGAGDEASAELVVDPSHRRRGHGSALVRAVLEAEPGAAMWAHGDLSSARALAEGLGLARTRELL